MQCNSLLETRYHDNLTSLCRLLIQSHSFLRNTILRCCDTYCHLSAIVADSFRHKRSMMATDTVINSGKVCCTPHIGDACISSTTLYRVGYARNAVLVNVTYTATACCLGDYNLNNAALSSCSVAPTVRSENQ